MRTRPRRSGGKRSGKRSKLRTALAYIELAILIVGGLVMGITGVAVFNAWRVLPKNYSLNTYTPIEATRIFSTDGIMLGSVFQENREVVPFKDIPKNLVDATVAVEDKRFYNHVGVDLKGIAGAVAQNIRGHKLSRGGSTLTQQLARNIYLTQKKTLSRKLQEAVLAVKLERLYSKDQILELYLNQVYYGSGAYGVEAASKVYFGKSVKDISLAQCALIAGLPQSPSTSSPYIDKDKAIRRRDLVLSRMFEQKFINRTERDDALAEDVRLVGLRTTKTMYLAPYFVDHVLKDLATRYGEDMIYKGGLRVYTTLNYQMQQAAERAIQAGLETGKRFGARQGALVCIDPMNGHIKAMVGGADYGKSQFNRATMAHPQPGSSFKAFVYTAVIDQRAYGDDTGPNTRISNRKLTLNGWTPKNYGGRFGGGSVSIRTAIARSINIPAVRAGQQVGITKVIQYARLLGIKSRLTPYPSLALGASGVPPIEMAAAYAVFAAGGRKAEPMAVVKVVNSDGATMEDNQPQVKTVLSPETAKTMDSLFRAVVTSGTGGGARGISEARGKTGTTNDDTNVWFIGYVPNRLVTAVWMGNDLPVHMRHSPTGGSLAVPVWRSFMADALGIQKKWASTVLPNNNHSEDRETEAEKPKKERDVSERREEREQERPPHDNLPPTPREHIVRVKVCSESGELAGPHCPSTYVESFVSGFQPTSRCSIHKADTETDSTGDAGD